MTGPTHAAIGLAATVLLLRVTDMSITPVALLLMLAGSLAPDIDGLGSISRPGTLLKRSLPRGIVGLLDSVGVLLSTLVRRIFGHRGCFHWPLVAVVMIAAALIWDWVLLFWFGWGYLWHILADFATKGGVPLGGPFSRRRLSCCPLRVGSWQEAVLFTAVVALVGWWGPELLPQHSQDSLDLLIGRLGKSL